MIGPSGPSMAAGGCVATTGWLIERFLRGDLAAHPTLESALLALQAAPGALVDGQGHAGGLVFWPVAVPVLGLVCGPPIAAAPDHTLSIHDVGGVHVFDPNVDLAGALASALVGGAAALRVDVDGDGLGDHTIAALARDGDGFLCSDPALGQIIRLDANLEDADIHWGAKPHPYRAVGLRPVFLAS